MSTVITLLVFVVLGVFYAGATKVSKPQKGVPSAAARTQQQEASPVPPATSEPSYFTYESALSQQVGFAERGEDVRTSAACNDQRQSAPQQPSVLDEMDFDLRTAIIYQTILDTPYVDWRNS